MRTFSDFWPYYLREHSQPGTRTLHFIGTTGTIACLAAGAALLRPSFVGAAAVCGYSFAWVGHFFVEHNRPATFRHPFWSFAADFRMWGLAVTGRLGPHLDRALSAGAARPAPAPPAPSARG